MTLASRLLGALYRLPGASHRVVLARDLPVPVTDGVTLLADHYAPDGATGAPTILVRSPYGRARLVGLMYGRLFAERGFHVLVQSCRGTFGSGGAFDPLRHEREDGLATVAWLRAQPWFSGVLGTMGPSYLGFVQWAIARHTPELRAMSVQVSASDMKGAVHAGGSFWLATALHWIYLVAHTRPDRSLVAMLRAPLRSVAKVRALAGRLPVSTLDEALVGAPVPYFHDWLAHDAGDPWWEPVDFSADVAHVAAPVHLTGGWYDLFLPQTLADYERLRDAGRAPRLTIGPWAHLSPGLNEVALGASLAWFRAHLLGDARAVDGGPVRVFVMGTKRWRDLASFPPPDMEEQRWYLGAKRALSPGAPSASESDRYRYDPDDPTPSVGGSSLSVDAGPKDNRALEARKDILLYTSAPLDAELTLIGTLRAELFVASSARSFDVFVRLCDVAPSGRSTNVSDGLVRVENAGPCVPRPVRVELWPTAHCFRRGHRLRVQVASGSHPRYARNLGLGAPIGEGTTHVVAEQEVFHDPERRSALVVPVVRSRGRG